MRYNFHIFPLSFLSKTHPPPRPPLFPYTTLFRSPTLIVSASYGDRTHPTLIDSQVATPAASRGFELVRSEEHTSELQSLRHLVCRLLLEKKKTQASLHED